MAPTNISSSDIESFRRPEDYQDVFEAPEKVPDEQGIGHEAEWDLEAALTLFPELQDILVPLNDLSDPLHPSPEGGTVHSPDHQLGLNTADKGVLHHHSDSLAISVEAHSDSVLPLDELTSSSRNDMTLRPPNQEDYTIPLNDLTCPAHTPIAYIATSKIAGRQSTPYRSNTGTRRSSETDISSEVSRAVVISKMNDQHEREMSFIDQRQTFGMQADEQIGWIQDEEEEPIIGSPVEEMLSNDNTALQADLPVPPSSDLSTDILKPPDGSNGVAMLEESRLRWHEPFGFAEVQSVTRSELLRRMKRKIYG